MKRAVMGVVCCAATLAHAQLPEPVMEVFQRAQVPLDSVAVVVREVNTPAPLLQLNSGKPMNPASVMKLVTTYAALETLGPAYTWKTEVLIDGDMRGGTLNGDLVLKGGGDPKLTVERFWLLVRQLRARGLVRINGDVVIDRTRFAEAEADPAQFDGQPFRAQNVSPDALLINFKTVRFQFAPSFDGKNVAITPDIQPAQLNIQNRTRLVDAPCGDWRERVKLDVREPTPLDINVSFTGTYPVKCGEQSWNVALLDHARFNGGVFAKLWADAGGVWRGAVQLKKTPETAQRLLEYDSLPLSDVARDINKFSNNVMARQLFLTLSLTEQDGATAARSTRVVQDWLLRKGIRAPELVMENGSGLSRIERISAASLAALLAAAWQSSVMPEFISSMSLAGIDGTFRRRTTRDIAMGTAHLKSGTLNDVRAIAGYVLANDGKRYIVAMMVNHTNAILTERAQEALLKWVYERNAVLVGPPPFLPQGPQ
jgi:D-alanyl-D-alanine carboxypeptidase/D-alanyl-D-alanine-endopeptidase (penicillin-binding protein 4)